MRMDLRALAVLFAVCSWLGAAACATAPGSRGPAAVAVWDLEDLNQGTSSESGLGELFASQALDVARARGYEVVERQRLLLVLQELRLGSGELADEGTRLRLGRLSGARLMVFGGYQTFGGQARVDVRLVDTETGKVVRAARRTVPAGAETQLQAARDAAGEVLQKR